MLTISFGDLCDSSKLVCSVLGLTPCAPGVFVTLFPSISCIWTVLAVTMLIDTFACCGSVSSIFSAVNALCGPCHVTGFVTPSAAPFSCDCVVQISVPTHRAFAVLALFLPVLTRSRNTRPRLSFRLTILCVRLVVAVVLFENTSKCASSPFFAQPSQALSHVTVSSPTVDSLRESRICM